MLDEVEARLPLIYRDGYNEEISFDHGGKDDEWCLTCITASTRFL